MVCTVPGRAPARELSAKGSVGVGKRAIYMASNSHVTAAFLAAATGLALATPSPTVVPDATSDVSTGGAPSNGVWYKRKFSFTSKTTLIRVLDEFVDNKTETEATYGPISTWDVSQLTDLSYAFCGCGNSWCPKGCREKGFHFNGNVSSWDVSRVTNIEGLLFLNPAFNYPLDSWDVSRVTSLHYTFYYAQSFNHPLTSWDTSRVTSLFWTFAYCDRFNQPLVTWDVSRVTTVEGIFFHASSFNQPLISWNVSSVTDKYYSFYSAVGFNQPLPEWDISGKTQL